MMTFSSPRSLLLAGVFIGAFTYARCRAAAGQSASRRGARCRRAASAGFAADRAARRQRSRRQACAGRAASDSGRAGQIATGKAQSAGRLQYRGLCGRHGERAFAGVRRQGHGVCRQPPARQGLCHRQQGRQARRSRCWPRASIGPTASPSRTARSTSPNSRRSPRSTRSKTISTIRRSRRHLRQPAQGRSPWLEVHRHRTRQQAVCSGRAARQQRPA